MLRALIIGFALAVSSAVHAQKEIPSPPRQFVLDQPGWLSARDEARLSAQLLEYERATSNQIVVAIFASLEGEDLGDFSQRVAEAWRIGAADRDNGVLLAIYAEDRQFSIEVGYGLEGAVTDLIAAQILEERLRPAFVAGEYMQGIEAAVSDLMAAARGEYDGSGRAASDRRERRTIPFVVFLPLLLIFLLGGRGVRRNYMAAYLIGSALGGSGRRGGFGGGGGFSGGGGSFGGGGARGGW